MSYGMCVRVNVRPYIAFAEPDADKTVEHGPLLLQKALVHKRLPVQEMLFRYPLESLKILIPGNSALKP